MGQRTLTAMSSQASLALMKFLSDLARQLGVGKHVYVVGGAVRNFVIDEPVKDVDLVIDSVALGKDSMWFAQQVARAIPAETNITTNQYGVALLHIVGDWMLGDANLQGEDIEIANARTESYGQGGYTPQSVTPATIEEDTYRREFTFNTLLWRLHDLADGPDKAEILDITGCGLRDLKDGVMRCPSSPDKTFSDDPSRMIRAVKFMVQYGFKIPLEVKRSIEKNKSKLKNIPHAALSNLLIKTFLRKSSGKKALIEMDKLGLLEVIKEIAQTQKPFRDALANWADREAKVEFIFDLMDMGLPSGKRLNFLAPAQQQQVREITVQMSHAEADTYVQVLNQPGKVLDTNALMLEFNLQGSGVRRLTDVARAVLLRNPAASQNPALFMAQVRIGLQPQVRVGGNLPIYAAFTYLSRRQHRGVSPVCDEVQDLIERLKQGDAGAARTAARALSRHPKLIGFDGVVVPAPRSSSGKPPLTAFAHALVRQGVGTRVEVPIIRSAPVESSRLRRQRDLEGVPFDDHVKSMGVQEHGIDPDEPILLLDDIVTTGTTLKAVAARLRQAGHRGPILGAAAGYFEPDATEAPACPVNYVTKTGNAALGNQYHSYLETLRKRVQRNKSLDLEHSTELWADWRQFYPVAREWLVYVLDKLAIPPKMAKSVEMVARLLHKGYGSGKHPKILEWFDANEKRFDMLDEARGWPERSEGNGITKVGPFTVHNTIQATGKVLDEAQDIVSKAARMASSSGVPGLAQMVYGEVYLVGNIARPNWAAWYLPDKDAIYLRPGVKGSPVEESARHLIHEVGHRYWRKTVAKAVKAKWNTHHLQMSWSKPDFRLPAVGEVLVPRVNKKRVQVDSYDQQGRAVLVEVGTGAPVGSVDRMKILDWVQESAHIGNFPSRYAMSDAEEHFCESLSFYCQGKLTGSNLAVFEEIILGASPAAVDRVVAAAMRRQASLGHLSKTLDGLLDEAAFQGIAQRNLSSRLR